MDLFFDTNVLVASSNQHHPQFTQASTAVARVVVGKDRGSFSQHSIAEIYATLMRMPVIPRVHPLEASRIIRENILRHFSVIPAVADDYLEALDGVQSGVGGSENLRRSAAEMRGKMQGAADLHVQPQRLQTDGSAAPEQ